jgi:hypothetical protein
MRRESKGVYHNNPGYSTTRRLPSPSSPPRDSARQNEQFRYQPPPVQTANLGYVDYFTAPKSGSTDAVSNFNNVGHQHGPSPIENSFFSSISYTLTSNPPNSPHQMFNGTHSQSPISGQPQMYSNGQEMLWNGVPSGNRNMGSDIDDMQTSEYHFGSFGSLDSMGLSTPDTATSSLHSEDFVFPIPDPTFDATGTTDPMTGLAIPGKNLIWFISILQGFAPFVSLESLES